RSLVRLAVQQLGFEVQLAASGKAALEMYRDTFALVLLDVRMPGLSGPETLAALRQAHPNVRCCFLTGESDGASEAELLACGALAVLQKPFPLQELSAVLSRLA